VKILEEQDEFARNDPVNNLLSVHRGSLLLVRLRSFPRLFAVGTFVGNCAKCLQTRNWTHGIFCANFGCSVGGWEPCQKMRCGDCYSSKASPRFFIADEDRSEHGEEDKDRLHSGWVRQKKDTSRYLSARNGDDLLVSFECDYCVF
jgi:hypothetical protein